MSDTESKAVEPKVSQEGDKKFFKKRGGGRHGNWKQQRGRGGGRFNGAGGNNYRRGGWKVSTEALIRESTMAREDKPLIFDLSSGRSKLELNEWFKTSSPTKIRRSDGVGWIIVLSEHITPEERKNVFESYEGIVSLRDEWNQITGNPEKEVTFDTIKELATKHDVKGGKWIYHTRGPNVDEVWQRLVLEFAYDKFPKETVALKISPVNDLDIPGGNGKSDDSHVVGILNRDFTNQTEVYAIEKALRNIPIRYELTYKPDIYSRLGIYRSNKYGIRPSIYVSGGNGEGGFKISNVAEDEWIYRPFSEPLQEENNNVMKLADLQAKLVTLREAVDDIDETISALLKEEVKKAAVAKEEMSIEEKKGDDGIKADIKDEIVSNEDKTKTVADEKAREEKKETESEDGNNEKKSENGDVDKRVNKEEKTDLKESVKEVKKAAKKGKKKSAETKDNADAPKEENPSVKENGTKEKV